MKKIFKLTIFSFLGPFIATFFVVLFTVLMQFLWRYIDDLVGKGLEWTVIARLLFFASASFVPMALPLAVLLSSIMTLGKLSESYELVALKSAGISLVRTLMPMSTIIIVLSFIAFYFSNNIIPRANLKFHSLLWDIRKQRPALDIKPGVFFDGIENYSIFIGKKGDDSKTIEDVRIYDHTKGSGNDITLIAKRGEMGSSKDQRWLVLKLYEGTRYEEMDPSRGARPTYPHNRLHFASYEMKFDLSIFNLQHTKEELFKDNFQMLNISQLQYYMDSLYVLKGRKEKDIQQYSAPFFSALTDTGSHGPKGPAPAPRPEAKEAPDQPYVFTFPRADRHELVARALGSARTLKETFRIQAEELKSYDEQIIKYRMEWHRKFALSLACLTLFFIGAPLGAVIRKGGIGLPTLVALILFIFYYVLTKVGEQLAKEQILDVFTGLWLPTIILMPIGFYLIHKSNRDRISPDFGIRLGGMFRLRNLLGRFRRKRKQVSETA